MKRQSLYILLAAISFQVYAQEINLLQKGTAYLSLGKYRLAGTLFDSALTSYPNKAEVYLNRGISRFNQLNYSEAEADFKAAISLNNSRAYYWMAKLYAEQNNSKAAVYNLNLYLEKGNIANPTKLFKDENLKKIYNSNDWQDFIFNFKPTEIQSSIIDADQLISKQNYALARTQTDKALSFYPNSATLLAKSAEIYEKMDNLPMARSEMKKAVDLEPDNSEYLIRIGDYCYELNDFSAANTYYKKALEKSSAINNIPIKISRTSLQLKNPAEAKKLSAEYLSLIPSDTAAIFVLADAYFNLKEYSEVLKTMNVLFKEYKPQASWFRLRGMTYYNTSTFKFASYDLSMSLDLEPNNAEANYYLGLSEFANGNKSLACYYWNRALKFGEPKAYDKISENCDTQK
jgi:tetratricopeptide (TPR) repeat protein